MFLRLFMNKSFALQYLWMGLGEVEKENKKSFLEIPAFSFFKSKKFYYN